LFFNFSVDLSPLGFATIFLSGPSLRVPSTPVIVQHQLHCKNRNGPEQALKQLDNTALVRIRITGIAICPFMSAAPALPERHALGCAGHELSQLLRRWPVPHPARTTSSLKATRQ